MTKGMMMFLAVDIRGYASRYIRGCMLLVAPHRSIMAISLLALCGGSRMTTQQSSPDRLGWELTGAGCRAP
jgi:hypothetical protein